MMGNQENFVLVNKMRVRKERGWEIDVECHLHKELWFLSEFCSLRHESGFALPLSQFVPCAKMELPPEKQRICAPTEPPEKSESLLAWQGQSFVQSRAVNHHPSLPAGYGAAASASHPDNSH